MEEGEPLDEAVRREILEETGIVVRPIGITGVYYNVTKNLLSVVFKASYVSGNLEIQLEEIKEAKFVKLTLSNIDNYITRPNMKSRIIDAMKAEHMTPYETWEVSPYNLLGRLDV